MDIKVIRQIDYKGIPIYIRKIDVIFEYLVIYENKLHEEYFVIEPEKGQTEYTKKQLEEIVKLVYFAAYKTIDALIENSNNQIDMSQ